MGGLISYPWANLAHIAKDSWTIGWDAGPKSGFNFVPRNELNRCHPRLDEPPPVDGFHQSGPIPWEKWRSWAQDVKIWHLTGSATLSRIRQVGPWVDHTWTNDSKSYTVDVRFVNHRASAWSHWAEWPPEEEERRQRLICRNALAGATWASFGESFGVNHPNNWAGSTYLFGGWNGNYLAQNARTGGTWDSYVGSTFYAFVEFVISGYYDSLQSHPAGYPAALDPERWRQAGTLNLDGILIPLYQYRYNIYNPWSNTSGAFTIEPVEFWD
jgi:hypothetical protein